MTAFARLLAPAASAPPRALSISELRRVREMLHASSELERASGLDRWSIARRFRLLYGTSPTRYRIMRR